MSSKASGMRGGCSGDEMHRPRGPSRSEGGRYHACQRSHTAPTDAPARRVPWPPLSRPVLSGVTYLF